MVDATEGYIQEDIFYGATDHVIEMKFSTPYQIPVPRSVADLETEDHQQPMAHKFHMRQVVGHADGKLDHVSEYNPEDMYSGDPERMKIAIMAL